MQLLGVQEQLFDRRGHAGSLQDGPTDPAFGGGAGREDARQPHDVVDIDGAAEPSVGVEEVPRAGLVLRAPEVDDGEDGVALLL